MSDEKQIHEWTHNGVRYRIFSTDQRCDCGYFVERFWPDQDKTGWFDRHDICSILPELARLADIARPRFPANGELPMEEKEVVCRTDEGAIWLAVYKKIACLSG